MAKFKVTYYYLATGMEGRPDTADYGIIEAETAEDAKEKVSINEYPEDLMYGPDNKYSSRKFLIGCLTATEVQDG